MKIKMGLKRTFISERTSKILIFIGIIICILSLILFLWKDYYFDFSNSINAEKFSFWGTFIGGIVGPLWALAGVILFYVALKDQRKDFKTNRDAFELQIATLKEQIKEFELQRKELEITRKVYVEQSNTLKLQQFESTFFSTLNMFHNIIDSITYTRNLTRGIANLILKEQTTANLEIIKGRKCFGIFYDYFKKEYVKLINEYKTNNPDKFELTPTEYLILIKKAYNVFFKSWQSDLGHYFRTIYNLIRFVDNRDICNAKYYTDLIRASLSSFEHLLLFYNGISEYGEERLKPLIIKYSMLDNMPRDLILDSNHLKLYPDKSYE
jgi:hypothetical protein